MGYYINDLKDGTWLPAREKVKFLIEKANAKVIPFPKEFVPDLVCVIHNGNFDAAGYCYDENEMKSFARPDDRPRTWLIVPDAAELSGYSRFPKEF